MISATTQLFQLSGYSWFGMGKYDCSSPDMIHEPQNQTPLIHRYDPPLSHGIFALTAGSTLGGKRSTVPLCLHL